MSETRVMALILYIFAIAVAYLLKRGVTRMAEKAIRERKLSTGIYRLIPIQGDQAVRLAKGYISGVKIYFWFIVLLFPIMFLYLIWFGAM